MDTNQRVLLVDDDPLIERVYSELLRHAGFEVDCVPSANEAIAKIKENPPDAVLLDLFLPKVNGVEVLKFIRSQRATRGMPVITFSTSATSRYVDIALREGATQFMAKDHFKPSQIVSALEKILSETKAAAKEPDLSELEGAVDSEQKKAFESIPSAKTELRDRWVAMANSAIDGRAGKLAELMASTEALLIHATIAGVSMLQQTLGPLRDFLKELQGNPTNISLSALRTIGQLIDLLVVLCEDVVELRKEPLVPGLVLIASERVTSLDVFTATKRANLTVVGAKEVEFGLQLAAENRFSLVFWDPDMPGPSASDLFARLRALATNKATPVVFFTKADDFEAQAREAAAGGFDIIGKPVLPPELTAKAVPYIVRDRLNAISVGR